MHLNFTLQTVDTLRHRNALSTDSCFTNDFAWNQAFQISCYVIKYNSIRFTLVLKQMSPNDQQRKYLTVHIESSGKHDRKHESQKNLKFWNFNIKKSRRILPLHFRWYVQMSVFLFWKYSVLVNCNCDQETYTQKEKRKKK